MWAEKINVIKDVKDKYIYNDDESRQRAFGKKNKKREKVK